MSAPDFHDPRLTEQRNPRTERIDVASSLEIVDAINAEDRTVAEVVHGVREVLARAIDLIVARLQSTLAWRRWTRSASLPRTS